ncbi:hypothetical protein [Mycobacteroides abscessus]|uniref:hypothetical protein n=1 Tax=Mycobacteroides abscessus TaxID=36809 RepID=UPI0010C96810|nr:hypothetical protein [Mycobacteroides abscessus]TKV35320.1 hypothetical protein CFA71_23930 [Mycobacteroides abscessus subsp. bolletii]
MARYSPVWLEIARQQYESFSEEIQCQVDVKLDLLLDDPESHGDYDKPSDQWTTDFGDGAGLIVYAVSKSSSCVLSVKRGIRALVGGQGEAVGGEQGGGSRRGRVRLSRGRRHSFRHEPHRREPEVGVCIAVTRRTAQ